MTSTGCSANEDTYSDGNIYGSDRDGHEVPRHCSKYVRNGCHSPATFACSPLAKKGKTTNELRPQE